MFAIKRGKVAILVGGDTVDTLAEEEIFGEMALLDDATRAATVVTLDETELVRGTIRASRRSRTSSAKLPRTNSADFSPTGVSLARPSS
jgi:CRP-like cAMP-binding protein